MGGVWEIGRGLLLCLFLPRRDIPGRPVDGGQATDDRSDRTVLADRPACLREVPGIRAGREVSALPRVALIWPDRSGRPVVSAYPGIAGLLRSTVLAS